MIKLNGLDLLQSLKILSMPCFDSLSLISTVAQNSLASHSFIGVVRPHTEKMQINVKSHKSRLNITFFEDVLGKIYNDLIKTNSYIDQFFSKIVNLENI